MAMTCRGILALPYANRLRLVAGASGGGNEIRWVHILEEPKYTAWLKGGELILLSGVVTGDREGALLSLLQDLFDREVAGVVLNLSTFLPAIPPSVLALGDRLGLPLFEMPAEVRMVDVSQSIAFAIFQQRQKTGQVEGALRDLLTGKRPSESDLRDNLLHTMACKAAIKAGWHTEPKEREALVREVLSRDDIKYCPHGRPVCIELTRKELEKQFKRT